MRAKTLAVLAFAALLSSGNLYAKKAAKDAPLPEYQVGITGLYVVPDREAPEVTVSKTEPGSPAAGKFQADDEILAVNGTKLALPDSRVQLGDAITAAEAADGKMTFTVKRGDSTLQVSIAIPMLGAYSKTWPVDCPKTRKIVDAAAAQAVERFKSGSLRLPARDACLSLLFLLSTAKAEHVQAAKEAVGAYLSSGGKTGSHTWNNGFLSIALGEYYLRTGEKPVLGVLKAIVDDSYERMTCGGWGHWNYPNPGYTRSGLVNAAGGPLFVGMVLARECGVPISDASFRKNLKYFYRFAGFGGVPYGDQRPGGGAATNGKSGMAGVGFSLLPDKCYQMAAQQYGVEQADSAFGFEGGHTGNMTNVLWRGLCAVHVPEDMQDHYRKHMDSLRWYYELCRHPRGGWQMLPTKAGEQRYATGEWGMCIALTYTAPWRTLRITGAPPTKFSKVKPVGEVMPKAPEFLTPRHAEGYKDSDFQDLETIVMTLKWDARNPFYKQSKNPGEPLVQREPSEKLPPIEYIARHMRHYNPVVRAQAACAIGYYGDAAIGEIDKALRSTDARVRRAGLEGLSGYHTFFMQQSPFTYTHAGIEKVVPLLVGILQNPRSDMWEIDGALWAISNAAPETIAKHLPLLTKFLKDDEWWVHSAAMVAISEAGTLAAPAMGELFEYFGRTSHVCARNDAVDYLRKLVNVDKVVLSPAVRRQALAVLGEDLVDLNDRERSYVRRGSGYYDAGNGRVLSMFGPEELGTIADKINEFLARVGDPSISINSQESYQNFSWVLTGDKWGNAGLISTIEKADAATRAKLMPGLKALLAGGLDKMFTGKGKGKAQVEVIGKMKQTVAKMVADYEEAHGPVRPYPPKKWTGFDRILHGKGADDLPDPQAVTD